MKRKSFVSCTIIPSWKITSRLIRATRFAARFHWTIEERTQVRYNAAVENSYIDHINKSAIGYEIEQLAYEEEPLHVMRALERENWLKVLNPHWSVAKVDNVGLSSLIKTRQQIIRWDITPTCRRESCTS